MDWMAYGLPVEGSVGSESRIASVTTDVLRCGPNERLGDLAAMAAARGTGICVVLNDAGVVLGVLRRQALGGDPAQTAEEAMRPGPSTFRPSVPIEEMIEFLASRNLTMGLVGTPDGRLMGAVTLDALRAAMTRHLAG